MEILMIVALQFAISFSVFNLIARRYVSPPSVK